MHKLFCALVFTFGPHLDALAAADSDSLAGGSDPLVGSLVQLLLGLLVVLAAIVALAWVLRHLGRFPSNAGNVVTVIGGVSMGSRERVVLLQVGATQLLVGVAPGRIQTLHVLEQPVTAGAAGSVLETSFVNRLAAALRSRRSP